MAVHKRQIRERLDEVVDPCSAANGTDLSVIEMELLDGIDIGDGHVTVSIDAAYLAVLYATVLLR